MPGKAEHRSPRFPETRSADGKKIELKRQGSLAALPQVLYTISLNQRHRRLLLQCVLLVYRSFSPPSALDTRGADVALHHLKAEALRLREPG